jgi:MFS family permease
LPVRDAYLVHVLPALLVLGLGIGASFPALMGVAMAGAGPEDAGVASGLVNTTAQVGGAIGLAVLATVASTHTHALIGHAAPTAAALTSGYHLALWIAAGLIAAAVVVAVFVLEREPALAPGARPVAETGAVGETGPVLCAEAA